MKPEQFIRDFGVEKARKVVEGAPDHAEVYADITETYFKSPSCIYDKNLSVWEDMDRGMDLDLYEEQIWLKDLKRLVESVDLIEKLGGYGKCKFYMTGMKLNKCDSVKCPKTGLIVSRAALEIAINDYRESIYGGGDE
ncbi:hypothetical protein ABTM55_01885 [Acinetobacter baumannii]